MWQRSHKRMPILIIYQIIDSGSAKCSFFVIVKSYSLGNCLAPSDGLHLGLGILGNVNLAPLLAGFEGNLFFFDGGLNALLVDVGDQGVAVERARRVFVTPKNVQW